MIEGLTIQQRERRTVRMEKRLARQRESEEVSEANGAFLDDAASIWDPLDEGPGDLIFEAREEEVD